MGELLGERESSSLLLGLFVHRLCPPRAGQLASTCLHMGDSLTPSPWETHSGTMAPQPNTVLPPNARNTPSSNEQSSCSPCLRLAVDPCMSKERSSLGGTQRRGQLAGTNWQVWGRAAMTPVLNPLGAASAQGRFPLSLSFLGSGEQLYPGIGTLCGLRS